MKVLVTVLLCVCVFITGCGGPGGTTITGTASFDDGSPLPRGVVNITGESGAYAGGIGEGGKYTIENVPNGTYTVTLTGVKDGEVELGMNYDDEGNFIESDAPELMSLILAHYSDIANSGLSITVPGDYDIKATRAQ